MAASEKPATSDSKVYKATFYGILNAQGDFWTPLAFDSEKDARDHITAFWGRQTDMAARCLKDFAIVPVRIRLTQLVEESLTHGS